MSDDYLAANRRNWEERVAIHRRDRSGFYAVDRFLAGGKELQAVVRRELGDVGGKRLVHLQCHFGLDTLILARHGAQVTGLDFSPAAIAEARWLTVETGLAAEFVCADVYEARQALSGEFDIAYVTWGTICWLPDMPRWARTVASLLRPGGCLYFADAHPNILILEERSGQLVHEYPIDTPPDAPLVFDAAQTYNDDVTALRATRTYEWIHSISRVVTALRDAGLSLDFLHEHSLLPWRPFPMCARGADGMWRLPETVPAFPLSYSLRATRPE